MHKMQKHFGQIFEAKKWNIIRMQLGQEKRERYEWEEQTGTSKDFAGEAEEDIDEDSQLEGPWTRWGSRFLAKEFYHLT